MCGGCYKRTPEINKKISEGVKRAIKEGRLKATFEKGNNYGSLKKGFKHSIETKEKIRKTSLKQFKGGMSEFHKKLISEAIKKNLPSTIFKKGNLPHNFNNWSSFEPYGKGFNNKLREQIRKRDNYRCQECFRHQDELFYKNGKSYKLSIHHIDYNKNNNNPNNLISLCLNCHVQTNYKRKDWINYYNNKLLGGG